MQLLRGIENWYKAKAARLDCEDNCRWSRARCHILDLVHRMELPNIFSDAIPRNMVARCTRVDKDPCGLLVLRPLISQLLTIPVTNSCTLTVAWILHRMHTKISKPTTNTTTSLQLWSNSVARAAITPQASK